MVQSAALKKASLSAVVFMFWQPDFILNDWRSTIHIMLNCIYNCVLIIKTWLVEFNVSGASILFKSSLNLRGNEQSTVPLKVIMRGNFFKSKSQLPQNNKRKIFIILWGDERVQKSLRECYTSLNKFQWFADKKKKKVLIGI